MNKDLGKCVHVGIRDSLIINDRFSVCSAVAMQFCNVKSSGTSMNLVITRPGIPA